MTLSWGSPNELRQAQPGIPLFSGGTVRIAPSRDGRPSVSAWKFWTSGEDVYAVTRVFGDFSRISVHGLNFAHLHKGKTTDLLFPPMRLPQFPNWRLAFQVKFPTNDGALLPIPEKLKKSDSLALIPVEAGNMLLLDLWLAETPRMTLLDLPQDVPIVWARRTSAGRLVALTAYTKATDKGCQDDLDYVNHNLTVSLDSSHKNKGYGEFRRITRAVDGTNLICVVPHGAPAHKFVASMAADEKSETT